MTNSGPDIDIYLLAFRIMTAIKKRGRHLDVVQDVLREVLGVVLVENQLGLAQGMPDAAK